MLERDNHEIRSGIGWDVLQNKRPSYRRGTVRHRHITLDVK